MADDQRRIHVHSTPSDILPYVAVFAGIRFLVAEGFVDVGVDRLVATTPGMPGSSPREQWFAILLLLTPILLSFWVYGWLAGSIAVLLAVVCWPLVALTVNKRVVVRTRKLALSGNLHDFFSLWAEHALSVRDKDTGDVYTRRKVVSGDGQTIAKMFATGDRIALDDAGPTMDELPTMRLFRMVRERLEEPLDGMTMDELIAKPVYVVVPGAAGRFKAEYEKQCSAAAIGQWFPYRESGQPVKSDLSFAWGYRAPTA